MKKPKPCPHDTVTRMRPAEPIYGTPGILYARYRCTDCGCEWDDPTEKPAHRDTVYQVKMDGEKHTEVWRNGERLSQLIAFTAKSEMGEPRSTVQITEYATLTPIT